MSLLKTGGEALSYCTSCKMDLNHTIVAMAGSTPIKVECRTCRKIHAYRAPKGITEPGGQATASNATGSSGRTTTARASAPRERPKAVALEEEWETKMAASRNRTAKTYSVKASFTLGDIVQHPKYGDGVVEKLGHPNKIEVMFRDDIRTLIHTPSAGGV